MSLGARDFSASIPIRRCVISTTSLLSTRGFALRSLACISLILVVPSLALACSPAAPPRASAPLPPTAASTGLGSGSTGNPATAAPPSPTATTASATTVVSSTGPSGDGATPTLTATNYAFAPPSLRAQAGQRLTVTVRNASGTLHNFSSTALGIDRDIPANGSIQIDFTAPSSGTAAFFCKYHQSLGMTGQMGDFASLGVSRATTTVPAPVAAQNYSYGRR